LNSNRFPYDSDVYAFIAGNVAVARKDIRRIAIGRTKTDEETANESFFKQLERSHSIFRAVYSLEKELTPTYVFPVLEHAKNEIWQLLPEEVRSMCWYCRTPVKTGIEEYRTCGHCKSCKEVATYIVGA
jgi:7-cyano-7-deazaguanine synthase in queuosine biosynthesis